MVLRAFKLSFPWVRSVFTKQARPNLASHALKVKMMSVLTLSTELVILLDKRANMIILNVIISKLSKHIKRLFLVLMRDNKANKVIIGKKVNKLGMVRRGEGPIFTSKAKSFFNLSSDVTLLMNMTLFLLGMLRLLSLQKYEMDKVCLIFIQFLRVFFLSRLLLVVKIFFLIQW